MKKEDGFTLIELLIVVAIIGIIAAIAIPSLLRARVSANEAAMVGDIRTVVTAQAAYQSANYGWYAGSLACLSTPSAGCIVGYLASAPTFLDPQLGVAGPQSKQGYTRNFTGAAPSGPPPVGADPASVLMYSYVGLPTVQDQSGVKGFAGDASGVICWTADGTSPATGASLTLGCTPL